MMGDTTHIPVNERTQNTYLGYDAAKLELAASTEQVVTPERTILQSLFYPVAADAMLKVNGSDKQIFLPKDQWTPVAVAMYEFEIESAEATDVYWQGWYA
jgi:hypothetical protein